MTFAALTMSQCVKNDSSSSDRGHNNTKPVADYYAKQGKQRVVDGLGTIEDIATRIRQAIG